MKRIFGTAGVLLLLLFLMRFPAEALSAARDGMDLWLNTLIPTLLPFMILTNILIYTGTAEKLSAPLGAFWKKAFGISPSGACALILGLLCGYPMGAKTASDMYSCGRIGKREAEYLLTFTNHASPVFIYTYIIHICLQDQISPLPVFGILLLSSVLTMLFFRFFVYGNQTIRSVLFLCLGSFFYPVCLLCCFFDFLYMVIRQLLLILFYKTEKRSHPRPVFPELCWMPPL